MGLLDESGPHHMMATAKATSAPAVMASSRKSKAVPGLWLGPTSGRMLQRLCIEAAAAEHHHFLINDARGSREHRDGGQRLPSPQAGL
jgi:hypothetical protein